MTFCFVLIYDVMVHRVVMVLTWEQFRARNRSVRALPWTRPLPNHAAVGTVHAGVRFYIDSFSTQTLTLSKNPPRFRCDLCQEISSPHIYFDRARPSRLLRYVVLHVANQTVASLFQTVIDNNTVENFPITTQQQQQRPINPFVPNWGEKSRVSNDPSVVE